ncbi:hypothetical protein GPECTOR_92g614 [Gonium pectorale]|uniref:Fe2OG dioxygenase domain-containing protein n=1 Tax=Gonium pectorale TaxID=33097 RepID=A0A150G0N9_GONPE|nr:hypothetical protein GPECTOR_92g614 [Gonium pectorale]|eukprot:KXZ43391.1 hypothetical protein GPECTOR_92g614 [Gonium pectorale]
MSDVQLAALARAWAAELAEHRSRQRRRQPLTAAAAAPAGTELEAEAAAAEADGGAGSAPEGLLPGHVAARLEGLSSVSAERVTRGSLGQQELADLAWSVAHYDRDLAARSLCPAMAVPFRVIPQFMPELKLEDFMAEVELRRDVIYLEDGSKWVRDALQALTGVWYDSVLINYYSDGKCGMRYHVDPLYDRWTPDSAVVSLGDTRTFIFREIRDFNSRWHYRVSNGDVVHMFGDCQERLQHCVRVERHAADAGPRMSLVFKERLRGPDGAYLLP